MLSKSSRHSKITGDFGERLVAYLLSRAGWEVAIVDHTGIDLIAARGGKRIGVSVKSRSRDQIRNEESINLPRKNIEHTKAACETFGLEPYYAFACDRESKGIIVYLAPEQMVLDVCGANNIARKLPAWPMKSTNEAAHRGRREVDWFDMATQECSAAFIPVSTAVVTSPSVTAELPHN